MAQPKKRTFEKWVADQLTLPDGERPTHFSLVYYNAGRATEIKTIPLGSKQWRPTEIADAIQRIAEEHCNGIAGMQTYACQAFVKDSGFEPDTYTFRITGGNEYEGLEQGAVLGTEPATGGGLLTQTMRHNEAMMRILVSQTTTVFTTLTNVLDRLGNQNAVLAEENIKAVELAKVAYTSIEKEKAELEDRREGQRRKTALMQKALDLGPGLINQLAGREVLPQSTVDTQIVEGLAKSLSADQLGKLMEILSPEQVALIAGRFSSVAMEKAEP